MKLLTQNAKMKATSKVTGVSLFNFGIPALKSVTGLMTCPNASACALGCYARSGTYRFKNSVNAYEKRLAETLKDSFVDIMTAEISIKFWQCAPDQKLFIRIHDSGDFYNEAYALKWFKIINALPNVNFYAYTKMVNMFKRFKLLNMIPDNLTIIYSFGGKEDSTIDKANDRHAFVFENAKALAKAKYKDGTKDDMVAAKGKSNKIGLVYHGVRSFENTNWKQL